MASDIVRQWNDRVTEIQGETDFVLDEISTIQRQEAELRFEIKKYGDLVKKERQAFERKLMAAEKRTETTQTRLETGTSAQQKAEGLWKQTMGEYESLSNIVSQIKKQELRLNNREDYHALMNAETAQWAQEEAQLHRRIHELRDGARRLQKENAEEVSGLRKELKEAELRLHSDRMGRDAEEGKYRSASVGRQSASQLPSRATSKPGSRKRDVMGDMTNNGQL